MSSSFRRGPKSSLITEPAHNTTSSILASPRFIGLERPGTKPWIGGLSLTSSGLRDFDAILGGGQPLGTAILIEEDRWTQDLASALARYWSAEALAQNQTLALLKTQHEADDLKDIDAIESYNMAFQQGLSKRSLEAFLELIPRNLHLDKDRSKAEALNKSVVDMKINQINLEGFGTIEEGDGNDEFDEEDDYQSASKDEGLTNAWQYKVSIQQERLGAPITKSPNESKIFCHSYDLSGKMLEQYPSDCFNTDARVCFVDGVCPTCSKFSCNGSISCATQLFHSCMQEIQNILNSKPNTVVRLLIMNAPVKISSILLPLLLSYVRSNSLPVVIMISIRTWLTPLTERDSSSNSWRQSLTALRRSCDAIFTCEGFQAMSSEPPPEFSDLAGIMSIRKLALQSVSHFADSTSNRRPPANRYGMKRDRRKMHIRLLHLPPEDFSANGTSVGSGARSGAGRGSDKNVNHTSRNNTALQPGMGCATNLSTTLKGAASLDF